MLCGRGGRRLVQELSAAGYRVSAKVLNAADYGVPQKRRRCLVVGFRDREPFVFPAPTYGPGRPHPWRSAGGVLVPSLGATRTERWSPTRARPDIRKDPYAGHVFNGGGRPINLEAPAPTLLASMGGDKPHGSTPLQWCPLTTPTYWPAGSRGRCRPGSPAHHSRGGRLAPDLPPAVRFVGTRSSRYRQVGNAVPPLLAAVLGRALLAQLEGPPLAPVQAAELRHSLGGTGRG